MLPPPEPSASEPLLVEFRSTLEGKCGLTMTVHVEENSWDQRDLVAKVEGVPSTPETTSGSIGEKGGHRG